MSRAEPMPSELQIESSLGLREPQVPRSGMVMPVVRALEVLSAFSAHDGWLGNKDIAERTGLPPSTVSRFLRSLVTLGFLHHNASLRQYRLAAAVLSLGYAATSHSDVQRLVREDLVRFACANNVTVLLAMRDRLDLIALESCTGNGSFRRNGLNVGTRIAIASTQMGVTLLASLPPLERAYLLENIARRTPEGWQEPEPNLSEAIRQLRTMGFCYSLSKWERDLGIISVPLSLPGRGLFVLTCLGSLGQMTKARVARELGPQFLALAKQIKRSLDDAGDGL
ncbi:IclR family transcriptional regulator [Pseudomonas sp.]|uniref:IclR family transcriptional regulator n=1 Tax=Pseudomonas sp. TaxID=306 RepID=UPI0027B9F20A|nr:helix-turn-helix domain-containing protein [Pseudomonas sp.]